MKWMLIGLMALTGCATVPISQSQADGAMEAGRAVVATELAYAKLPRCRAGASWSQAVPCSTLAGVKALAPLSQLVVNDINALETDTRNGTATYNEAQVLIVAIGNLQSAIGVLQK